MSAPTITSPGRSPPAPARSRRLVLVASPDVAAPRARVLEPGAFEIGREVAAPGLRLADPELSRRHARITVGDDVELADLGSRNGIFVGGQRVQRAVLAPGAVVRLGGTLAIVADDELPAGVPLLPELPRLRGGSIAMQRVRGEIALAAPRPVPVLVLGESGVGKERVAEELHRQSGRRGAWVPVNCAALPAELAESELFGHVAGAFTGATARADGLFAAAAGGTIFLDEIGELPPPVQAKLLRVLASGEIRRVGSATTDAIDVRVVAATHRAVEAGGGFRSDLLARLAGWTIRIPPLRDRKDDVLDLAAAIDDRAIDVAAAEALLLHDWPGNVRELEHVLRRARILAGEQPIGLVHLPDELRARLPAAPPPATSTNPRLDAIDRRQPPSADTLREVLAHFDGNVAAAARFFGKDRRQVYRWMQRHGLALPDGADDDRGD